MNQDFKDLIFVIGFVTVITVSAVGLHEYTHMYLFNKAGCDTELNVLDQENPRTAMAVASVSAECNGTAKSLNRLDMKQSTVEAVGYQIIPLYILIGAVMAFTIISNNKHKPTKSTVSAKNQELTKILVQTSEGEWRKIPLESPKAGEAPNSGRNPITLESKLTESTS